MGSKDSTGPGRGEGGSGGSSGGSSGAGTGPGRNEGAGRDGNQGGRGTGSGGSKRFLAFLTAIVVSLFLWVATPAHGSPVSAQAINGCDDNNVCLYDWINNNYASGFWQRPLSTMRTNSDGGVSGCTNLSNHQWHDLNGSPNGTASSGYVIRSTSGTQQWRVQYYDYLSCGAGGGPSFFVIVAPGELNINTNYNSLGACDGGSCDLAWENRISSIRVTYWP